MNYLGFEVLFSHKMWRVVRCGYDDYDFPDTPEPKQLKILNSWQ